ncbi:hypothetical protein, partial [Microbulbifer sp.]|uniref:hypothetical protein n=1 Tax=Microbulbifer sp. TaxID=1908541 RepID=UPI002F94E54B
GFAADIHCTVPKPIASTSTGAAAFRNLLFMCLILPVCEFANGDCRFGVSMGSRSPFVSYRSEAGTSGFGGERPGCMVDGLGGEAFWMQQIKKNFAKGKMATHQTV